MKTLVLRPARWAGRHRRSLIVLFFVALLTLLGAHPSAHAADVFNNIDPAPQLPPGGWVGRYPVGGYQLDQYFPAISVGFTSGIDASGVAPMIAYFGAEVLWEITSFLANGVILLFGLAFNLDLVNGSSAGSGALAPVSQAIHNLYESTFGTPWLIAAITLVGCWAMWKALVQRRYTETAGALSVSALFFVLAIGIVTQPEKTIAPASKLSNQLSTALLSLGSEGSESQAKTAASDQLFELLVLNPWTVLEFGGIEHCATVSHGKPQSVAVRPLSSNSATDTQLASQLEHGTEVKANGKTCINDRNKYATHFLQFPPGSHRRGAEHEALEHGDDEDLPASDAGKTDGTYPLDPADEPAAEAMGKGGQYQRLLLAIVILLGEIGAYLLLGALAVGVILAQILLLTLLAFAPVALLIGIFPGRGHEFFRKWLSKLAGYLARKVIYSLILAIVLAVCSALDDATSNLGWLLAFTLQAAFLWTVFLQRNRLTSDLLAGTVGPHAASDGTNRLANLYYASRLARMTPHLSIPRVGGKLPDLAAHDASQPGGSRGGASPGAETPPAGEGPSGAASPPPPTSGGPSGGGPTDDEQFGDDEPPTTSPAPNETPTHGPGAPSSSDSGHEDRQAPTVDGAPAASGRAGAQPPEDELPQAEAGMPSSPSATTTGASARPADSVPEARAERLSPPAATAGSASSRTSSSPPPPPAPVAPPAPAPVVEPPPPVAPASPGAPGIPPRRSSGDDLGDSQPSPQSPQPAAAARLTREQPPTASTAPAIGAEEPVSVLLKARYGTGAVDPASQEDEHL
jgi:TrbL/VirB6 plasmid conjugal transfer protein